MNLEDLLMFLLNYLSECLALFNLHCEPYSLDHAYMGSSLVSNGDNEVVILDSLKDSVVLDLN